MTQNSTPQPQGPSTYTLDFIRQFARTYKPHTTLGTPCIVHYDAPKTLGEC